MFAINWVWQRGAIAYVMRGNSNNKPYTEDIHEAQHWKTYKNAERFLNCKDPSWAKECKIVTVPNKEFVS